MSGPWEDNWTTPAPKPPPPAAAMSARDARVALRTSKDEFQRRVKDLPAAAQKIGLAKWKADPQIKKWQALSFGDTRNVTGAVPQDASPLRTQATSEALTAKTKQEARAARDAKVQREYAKKSTGRKILTAIGDVSNIIAEPLTFGLSNRAAEMIAGAPSGAADEFTNDAWVRSGSAAIPAWLSGALLGGKVGTDAITGTGKLLTKGSGKVNALGEGLIASQTLRRGETGANVAKLAATGAGFGAADAAVRGNPILPAAATGAVAAPALVGGAKLVKFFGTRISDLAGMSSAKGILRRYTSISQEELTAKAQAHRKATGAEPTVYELLPLGDRQKIAKEITGRSSETMEQTIGLVQSRTRNVGPEMKARADELIAPRREPVIAGMADDLAASRNLDEPTGADFAQVRSAANEPRRLQTFANDEASNIMAPHDAKTLYGSLDEILPHEMRLVKGEVHEVPIKPEITSAINSAAGTIRLRPSGEGINGKEVSQILSKLRETAFNKSGDIAGDNAAAAVIHIEDELMRVHPDVADDVLRMRDAYAARMRMAEGQAEGYRTRTGADPQRGENFRAIDNAYDTPEGTQGRILGQSNKLTSDLSGTPQDALRTVDDLANSGSTQRAIAGNLGDDVSTGLTAAAESQARGIQALAAVAKEGKIPDEGLNIADIGHTIAGLNPGSMATTKAWALARLARLPVLPAAKAKALVDMLFSQNPALTQKALTLLRSNKQIGDRFLTQLRAAALAGQTSSKSAGFLSQPQGEETSIEETPVGEVDPWDEFRAPEGEEEPGPWDEYSSVEEGFDDAGQAIQSIFPGIEVTQVQRDPNSDLGRKNPKSWHVRSSRAVDVRPIPGMAFEEFIQTIRDAGFDLIDARDEVNNPSDHATGPHWHVVFG